MNIKANIIRIKHTKLKITKLNKYYKLNNAIEFEEKFQLD